MNDSGRWIRAALDWYGFDPAQLLLVVDDMDLPLGRLRLRAAGSHGGHNGLRSVIAHLGTQIDSARRLLGHVLKQGEAIRNREVDAVRARFGEIQAEMDGRGRLELQRTALLTQAGSRLGLAPAEITLDRIAVLMTESQAAQARELSAELRGLLAEIERQHTTNRALMRQELAFLEHLTRLIGLEPEAGYRPAGAPAHRNAAPVHRAFDFRA
jgi:hypothetical protein